MTQLGIAASETCAICHVLAAIFHLGAAGAITGSNQKAQFGNPAAGQRAATSLGMTQEELQRAIFSSYQPQHLKPTLRHDRALHVVEA